MSTRKKSPAKPKAKPLSEAAADLADKIKGQVTTAVAFVEAFETARPLILRYEGVHDDNPDTPQLEPAPDPAGWFTLGYGHLIIDSETGSRIPNTIPGRRRVLELYPNGITVEDAVTLMQSDCYVRFVQLRQNKTFCSLSAQQQGALLCWAYNLGVNRLWKSTMWRIIRDGIVTEEVEDPAELWGWTRGNKPLDGLDKAFTAWSRATNHMGIRSTLPGLFARRLAEYVTFKGTDPLDAIEQADLVTRAATRNV